MSTKVAAIVLALVAVSGVAQAQSVIYVDQNASLTPHDGSSWCNAFLTLDEALDASTSGFTIKVADGTYKPNTNGLPETYEATFTIESGVEILGGYAGCGAVDPDARDFTLHETWLSGEVGDPTSSYDNSLHIMSVIDCDAQTVIDGFSLADGSGPHSLPYPFGPGGAIFIQGGEPQVSNCTFRDQGSYAIVNSETDSRIEQCLFEDNQRRVVLQVSSSVSYADCVFRNNLASGIESYVTDFVVTGCEFDSNFNGGMGGAIDHTDGAAYITDSVFTNNESSGGYGGALYVVGDGYVEIHNCTFTDNVNHTSDGGAVIGADAISNCRFERNRAVFGDGGAVWGPTNITNCEFIDNYAAGSMGGGGAVYTCCTATLRKCTFINNSTLEWGGAIGSVNGEPEIIDCVFSGNSSKKGGAISKLFEGMMKISNCVLIDNEADTMGGGLYFSDGGGGGGVEVYNSSFSGNDAPQGGAIGSPGYSDDRLVMVNSILWGNTGTTDPQISIVSPATADVTYSCIEGGYAGTNNISADPQFADADLRLSETSPCIEAGDNDAVPVTLTTDLDGNPRIAGCFVDMGAYEFPGGRPLMGDIDGDCDLDLVDYEYFDVCLSLSGPGEDPIFQECKNTFDFDSDGDIDLADFAAYQQLAG